MSDELPEWATSLPETLHQAPHLKNSETPEQFLEHIANDAAWRGQSIRLPSDDAPPEMLQEMRTKVLERIPGLMPIPDPSDPDNIRGVLQKIGLPETADAYTVPEGLELPADVKAQAHALNMTQSQFEAYSRSLAESATTQTMAQEQQLKDQQEALRKEWGAAAEQRTQAIDKWINTFQGVPESLREGFKQNALPVDVMQFLHNLAVSTDAGEGGPIAEQGTGASTSRTPEQAELRLVEIEGLLFAPGAQQNPAYPLWIKERNALMLEAFPDSETGIASMKAG